jgi:hypothetical protein
MGYFSRLEPFLSFKNSTKQLNDAFGKIAWAKFPHKNFKKKFVPPKGYLPETSAQYLWDTKTSLL